MGWLGDVAGALTGGIVSGLFGMSNARDAQNRQAEQNQSAMAIQHEYNVDDYKHRYQWAVNDLRSAGLNPILAATNGIGGSINGTGLAQSSAVMAPTPDMASAFNSANQISNQRQIAKMQNELGKDELELRRLDVNSAIEQRKNDITIANGRFALEKMVQEAAVKRADALNDATIQNMKDRLKADIEHYERMDMNGASMAAAALASANAHGLMAAVSEKLSITREQVMQAQEAYIGLQSDNAEESLKWQRWLNDHNEVRGAVGFIGSLLDTAGLVGSIAKPGSSAFRNIMSGSDDIASNSGYYDESWFR